MRIVLHRKGYTVLLLSIVATLLLCIPMFTRADATVDSLVDSDSFDGGAMRSVVFTSLTTGYVFYDDSNDTCVYRKTTDGGATWGNVVTVDSQTDCVDINIWYDRWTPGDTGTLIHIVTWDSGVDDLFYRTLNTSNDTLSGAGMTTIDTGTAWELDTLNLIGITKGTDGTLYVSMKDLTAGTSRVKECSTTCTTGGNWSTMSDPFDTDDAEATILLPLAGGDIMLIQVDATLDDIEYKIWDDSAGSWSGSWTDIDGSIAENTTYAGALSAAVHPVTGDIYLAYLADTATLDGDNDDIRTAIYSGGSWTTKTAAYTNNASAMMQVSLGLLGDEVVVGFTAAPPGSTAVGEHVYWKSSSDSMTTWNATSGPATTTLRDHTTLALDMYNVERMAAVYVGDGGLYSHTLAGEPAPNPSSYIKLTGNIRFLENLAIVGTVGKGWGTFVIDHVLRPATHLLYHSFVESPDVKNIYDGVATLDEKGEATITLPDYFMALNTDFRYQFSPLKQAMPDLHIKKEIADNYFTITGGVPRGKVSWQVTGNRHDPYIQENPIINEVRKGPDQIVGKGECLFEPLCE